MANSEREIITNVVISIYFKVYMINYFHILNMYYYKSLSYMTSLIRFINSSVDLEKISILSFIA